MYKLIRNVIITVIIGVFWFSWIYYVAPQLNSKNMLYDSGICVSVESETSWHGRFGAHTTYYILQLDTGNRYYVSGRFFDELLREKAEDGSTLQISYYKNRHKLAYDAKEAVEIQVGKDIYLTLDESNRVNRNTRIFSLVIYGFVLSIVLYISIIQIEKQRKKPYIKFNFTDNDYDKFAELMMNNLEKKRYIRHSKSTDEKTGNIIIYIKRNIFATKCFVFSDADTLQPNNLECVKLQTETLFREEHICFASVYYIISVKQTTSSFKRAVRNYVKQRFNRKTYYVGMIRSSESLFLPNNNQRVIRKCRSYITKNSKKTT